MSGKKLKEKSHFPPPVEAPPFAVKKIVRLLRYQRTGTSKFDSCQKKGKRTFFIFLFNTCKAKIASPQFHHQCKS
jgi:hypothetical protein